ncbi:MAG: acyltransferase [Planctomycetaceae bacterium]
MNFRRPIRFCGHVLFVVLECILRRFAMIEYALFYHYRPRFLRSLYLRFMQVEHESPFAIGNDFFLRFRGNLRFGKGCGFGSFCRIWNYHQIEIGDDFLAAGGLTINTAGHNPDNMESIGGSVTIGSRVWCGLNVTILGGVTIGDDAVVGACSLVNKDVPAGSIVVGIPARVQRQVNRTTFNRWAENF